MAGTIFPSASSPFGKSKIQNMNRPNIYSRNLHTRALISKKSVQTYDLLLLGGVPYARLTILKRVMDVRSFI